MHGSVIKFVEKAWKTYGPWMTVCEYGAADINGSIRDKVPCKHYMGIDIRSGRGVDVVADAATFTPLDAPDAILCLEVLEHCENWELIIANAARTLNPHGVFVMTCACEPREPHSMDGVALKEGEFYENVDPKDLQEVAECLFAECHIECENADLRLIARYPICSV